MNCNPIPPQNRQPFDEEHVRQVPDTEGVFQLLDPDHNVLSIRGTADLRQDLKQMLENNEKAALFEYEENRMYSRRESELIQKYLQAHGEMPGGADDDMEDLF